MLTLHEQTPEHLIYIDEDYTLYYYSYTVEYVGSDEDDNPVYEPIKKELCKKEPLY